MKYKIYKLYFKTGLRIGNGKIDSSVVEIPADTIFSAIINEAAQDEEKIETILEEFKNRKLIISNAFPFIGEELFLPKPLLNISDNTGDSTEKKLYKKINHIPLSLWDEYIKGKSNPKEIVELNKKLGKLTLDTKIYKKDENEIYNLSYYRFYEGNGLYFILGYEEDYELFDDILYSLSFTGIGGKKTSGLGKFEMEEDDITENLKNKLNNEKSKMLLASSMARIEELETLDKDAKYKIIRRGGFSYSQDIEGREKPTFKKNTMYYFDTGSIFNNKFEGDVFEIGDNGSHKIYRYGIPLWMEV